ncbi:MAG: FtsQ-type POTRA domain-containing protein [Acidobacteria bacterium]|nr:FtsQ-type POTRA domain-containing protein [Acidobacteriota bacterium]
MAVSTSTDKRFRRVHVTPRSRRRFALSPKGVALAALAGTCVLYGGYRLAGVVLSSGALTVTRITVGGNSRLSHGEVLSLVDGLQGRSMLLLDLDEWRQKLLASPWVADAALRRVLPGTVDVAVSERRPVGIARLEGGLYLIDQRGSVIDDFGPGHADLDLPLIDGLAAAHAAGASEPAVDEGRAALAVRLLASLETDPDLAGRVSQIDASDVRDAVVMLKGDTTLVRVGEDRFAERLRSYLDLAPALRERVPEIDYVDVRFGERVYVRPR